MSDKAGRRVPEDLSASWSTATGDPDPLSALHASVTLNRELDRWQATLVAEAVQGGATWEQVGDALGISRQAAWARFRDAVGEEGRTGMEDDAAELKARIQDAVRSLREEMRAIDRTHRQARMDAVRQLRELDHQVRQERQELKERVKQTVRSLQDELRGKYA